MSKWNCFLSPIISRFAMVGIVFVGVIWRISCRIPSLIQKTIFSPDRLLLLKMFGTCLAFIKVQSSMRSHTIIQALHHTFVHMYIAFYDILLCVSYTVLLPVLMLRTVCRHRTRFIWYCVFRNPHVFKNSYLCVTVLSQCSSFNHQNK